MINSVIGTLPDAIERASQLKAQLDAGGGFASRLHGAPVLVKDNIAIAGQPTTAGSLALKDNIAAADAPLVARLRASGLVILGRTNLSEWANIRSTGSTSGWSAVGGLTVNPWGEGRNACGSSSGSAAAVATRLAPLAVGTETDGSITCPAGVNGVVGFKPSLGVVSTVGVVPIAHSQDTAGPMARTVADAAALLDAMRTDGGTVGALAANALQGARIGVLRDRIGDDAAIVAAFDAALAEMRAKGATIVEIADSRAGLDGLGEAELVVLLAELKSGMAAYLATTDPARVPSRTLADLIAFNKATPEELRFFDQDLFERAQAGPNSCEGGVSKSTLRLSGLSSTPQMLEEQVTKPLETFLRSRNVETISSSTSDTEVEVVWTTSSTVGVDELSEAAWATAQRLRPDAAIAGTTCVSDAAYLDALATSKGLATRKLAALLTDNDVVALVGVTNGPAWLSTLGKGDTFSGPSVSQLPAIAGAPHLTVPMALIGGLPVGLSLIGSIGDDARVLALGHAFQTGRPDFPEPPLTIP